MTEEGIGELYTRLAFQYESSIEVLLAKGLIDMDIATATVAVVVQVAEAPVTVEAEAMFRAMICYTSPKKKI